MSDIAYCSKTRQSSFYIKFFWWSEIWFLTDFDFIMRCCSNIMHKLLCLIFSHSTSLLLLFTSVPHTDVCWFTCQSTTVMHISVHVANIQCFAVSSVTGLCIYSWFFPDCNRQIEWQFSSRESWERWIFQLHTDLISAVVQGLNAVWKVAIWEHPSVDTPTSQMWDTSMTTTLIQLKNADLIGIY